MFILNEARYQSLLCIYFLCAAAVLRHPPPQRVRGAPGHGREENQVHTELHA